MVRFYGNRILNWKMTIDEVPIKWRYQVELWLQENSN